MKKNIITLFAIALSISAFAQTPNPGVGIGVKKVNPGVALEIAAQNKGVLIPRVAITDLKVFGLNGNKPTEGVLIYNPTPVGDAKDEASIKVGFHYWSEVSKKWELISGESQLKTVIEKTETKLTEQIKEITEIKVPGDTNLSYLVAFEPKDPTAATTTGKLTYLVPEKDDKGNTVYSKKGISFEELVQGQETKTFFREIMGKVKDKDGKEVDAIVAYEYFNEEVIIKFMKDNPTIKEDDLKDPVKGLKPGTGYKIDIVGVVTNTVKEIFEKENTIKEITNIIDNAKGVMHVKLDVTTQNPTFYYLDKDNKEVVVDFNAIETKTKIGKGVATDKKAPADYTYADKLVDADLKAGQIIYKYDSEQGTFYINMTEDVVQTFNNNEEIKNTLNEIVTKHLSQGGNVYYGEIKPGEGKVLYELVGDVKTPIDISKDILKVIESTTNNLIIEKIKELTTVKVVEGTDVATGETLGGKAIYKGQAVVTVDDKTYGYDSAFTIDGSEFITINPHKIVLDKDGKGTLTATGEDFGRLLKVSVLTKGGSVLLDSATDVKTTPMNKKMFTFSFGLGSMYTPLVNGDYEVIYEYVVK